jgi:hypothetical protein
VFLVAAAFKYPLFIVETNFGVLCLIIVVLLKDWLSNRFVIMCVNKLLRQLAR